MDMEPFKAFLRKQAQELPRLPVPPLEQTIERYLKSIKPFVTEEEYKTSESLANNFCSSDVGKKLQKLLELRAKNTDNWLAEWWINLAYLDIRKPLPVFSNTNGIFPPQTFKSLSDQLRYSAAFIAGFLDFNNLLMKNKFPPDQLGPFELDMSQFEHIFSPCRIPGEFRDILRHSDVEKHIIIAHNSHLFAVPVYDERGKTLNQKQIISQLQDVFDQSTSVNETPIGILTSENRTTWFHAREALLKASEKNREYLNLIETCLFMIAMDPPLECQDKTEKGRRKAAEGRMMHGGGGTKGVASNRWFDLMNQFIITSSGEIGMSYEHSHGEPHQPAVEHMEKYLEVTLESGDFLPPAKNYGKVQRLDFIVPDYVRELIKQAKIHADDLSKLVEIHCYPYTGFGRRFVRSLKIGSIDSFIQMALQLTFYRLHKQPAAQYESATARKFYKGRTETIRTCSVETMAFVETMLKPSASAKEKLAALRVSMDAHKDYVINAMTGHGVDRHLLGLRLSAMENGITDPSLFHDPGFIRSSNFRLSTSQVPTVSHSYCYFSPLVPDGYGCCYNPRDDEILFGTTAYNACPDTSAIRFSDALETSLNEIQKVVSNIAGKL